MRHCGAWAAGEHRPCGMGRANGDGAACAVEAAEPGDTRMGADRYDRTGRRRWRKVGASAPIRFPMYEHAASWPFCDGEMATRIRDFDWRDSALGPIAGWPAALRHAVGLMLESPVPIAIAWGSAGYYLYNDALRPLLGQRHPRQFALPMIEAWPEIEAPVAEMLAESLAGRSVQLRGHPFDLMRDGVCERLLFDVDYSPIRDDAGRPAGMWLVIRELARESAVRAAEASGDRERCLLALSDALRDLADPGEIHDVASALLGMHLQVDRIGHGDSGHGGLVIRQGWPEPGPRRAWPAASLAASLIGDGASTAGAVIDDVIRDPRLDASTRALLVAHEVAAAAAPPPRAPGIDRFVALSRAPRRWTALELDLIRDVGERVHSAAERARAKRALATSEQRFRAVAEQAEVGIAIADRDGCLVYVNDRHCDVMGRSRAALLGVRIKALTHAEDWPTDAEHMEALYRDGTPFTTEKRVHVDGEPRWIRLAVGPWRDGTGAIAGSLAVSLDLTSRRLAEQGLRDGEARFRQFGDASSDVLWIRNARTLALEYLSPAFEAIYGQTRAVSLRDPDYWLSMVHPEDLERVRGIVRGVRRGARASYEFRIVRPADGQVVWIRNTDFPVHDDAGEVKRIGGIGRDITREREDAALMETLVAELQHRTRNLIAVVQLLARRTQQESDDIEVFGRRFEQRLAALGRVQGLLSQRPDGHGVTFDALLLQELDAHGVGSGEDPRVELRGPAGVPLRSRLVQTLALALHELTTNALKYGALSDAGGRLAITWSIEGDDGGRGPALRVIWEERGVRLDPVQAAEGYGRELIERALPYQLKAQTHYELRKDGVFCTIEVPLDNESGMQVPG